MRPGDAWGAPASGAPDAEGGGSDADLAALVQTERGRLVRFVPDASCDFARAIGLTSQSNGAWEVAIDVLEVGDALVVNMLTLGTRPDRLRHWSRTHTVRVLVDGRPLHEGPATTVVVANGQYLGGNDVVPRGHPGDGRLEVQVYALTPGERGAMRRRLGTGTHLPHPRIVTGSGRQVEVRIDQPAPAELDGVPTDPARAWDVAIAPAALRLLV
jgi:YegS C-terminal NAD kinase beta sandwich-like domain